MVKHKGKKKVFRSMEEFEKNYFPKAFEERISEKSGDERDLGVCWAKEYLDKIKNQLKES